MGLKKRDPSANTPIGGLRRQLGSLSGVAKAMPNTPTDPLGWASTGAANLGPIPRPCNREMQFRKEPSKKREPLNRNPSPFRVLSMREAAPQMSFGNTRTGQWRKIIFSKETYPTCFQTPRRLPADYVAPYKELINVIRIGWNMPVLAAIPNGQQFNRMNLKAGFLPNLSHQRFFACHSHPPIRRVLRAHRPSAWHIRSPAQKDRATPSGPCPSCVAEVMRLSDLRVYQIPWRRSNCIL